MHVYQRLEPSGNSKVSGAVMSLHRRSSRTRASSVALTCQATLEVRASRDLRIAYNHPGVDRIWFKKDWINSKIIFCLVQDGCILTPRLQASKYHGRRSSSHDWYTISDVRHLYLGTCQGPTSFPVNVTLRGCLAVA